MEHSLTYKQGVARMRPHRVLANALARHLKTARVEVDLQRMVQDLQRAGGESQLGGPQEARLDIVACFPGSAEMLWIDITIRSPHAARYTRASSEPGSAADAAYEDKLCRYAPSVLPVCLETYGRVCTRSLHVLAELAQKASFNSWQSRYSLARLQSWIADMQRAAIWDTAEVDQMCLGGSTLCLGTTRRERGSRQG